MFDPKTILILAPHTDDGELGCGGSIAKFCSEGREVYYAAFSTCKKSLPEKAAPDTLEKECRAATKELGVAADHLIIYEFEVREFPEKRQLILEEMVILNANIKPDLVLTPSAADIHQDHGIIHSESRRAFKNSTLLGYELPWNQSRFQSTFFIQLSSTELDKKVNALRKYQSQVHRNYMSEDFIRSLAKVRGVQCNNLYAEAFEVYRMIV
jgi:LmbE family N-acetylglucosaminyl deacetylase